MESLKRALEQIGRLWANLNATQRVVLSAAAVLMVLLLLWGSTSATPSWVRVAAADPAITKKLQERNQKFEVRGNEILVPKEDADRVVLELAGEATMSDDAIWKFLETSDPFVDRRQKDRRYKLALEQKLSAMIRRVEFVRNAMVFITPGSESDRLIFEGSRAKASVQIDLQEGARLSSKNVVAIANLVAKAVPGLEPDQVVITDNKLNSYSLPKADGGTTEAVWFRDYEEKLEERIKNEIKQGYPTARVTVRVTARNSTSQKETKKFTNPKAEQEEERRTKKGGSGAGGASLKGESSAPPSPESSQESEQELRTKNRFDEEKVQTNDPAGRIERISVGVLIPVEVGPDGKELAEAEKQKADIVTWAKAAADAPVSSVSVSFIPSKKPEQVAPIAEADKVALWISAHWLKVVLGLLTLAGFIFIVRVIQVGSAKDSVEELQALTTALSETREAQAELALPGEGELGKIKQGLQDMVARNPQGVAASLKSFMSGR